MSRFFTKISALVQDTTGWSQLTPQFKKFATMQSCFYLFQGFVSVYVATLLMRVSGDGDIVRWHNIVTYFFTGTMMMLAVVVMRKTSTNLVTRIGILGFILMYTVLLVTMDYADKMQPVISVLNGISNAFYWLTYSTYVTAFTGDSKRDVALAFLGFVNGIITLTMPAISGFIIESIGGNAGYYVAFGLAFGVAVGTIFLSLRLPKHIQGQEKERGVYYGQVFKAIAHSKASKAVLTTEFARGLREGTFSFLLNLLLFEAIQSETLTGINTLLTGIGSIVSFWVIGKVVKPHNRVRTMFIGTIVLLAGVLLLVFGMNPVTLIIFSFLNAFFIQFIVNPSSSIFYLVVQKKAPINQREEYFAIRELILNMGRVVGIFMLFLFPKTATGYVIAIILLTLTQFLAAGMSKRTTRLLIEEEKENVEEQ